MLTTKTSKSALLLGGVNGQRNPPGGGGPKRVVTRRRRTKDEDANTTHTNKKKLRLPRAFAREYPTYDELPGNAHGGRKPETQSNGRWQQRRDFFSACAERSLSFVIPRRSENAFTTVHSFRQRQRRKAFFLSGRVYIYALKREI